ncbi:conserved hypothetical protein [Verticillium alfalfae VaMs.102]|uniref:tRNA (adenine(58)-N(1))-methyltransferase non-catalytic subunit TRM6 n=1 Tax=Verticillium alfalfae (strain VaMs.102 / ATCC MYA-4576 / FGSC 10136) TaxID=526221 RepID=C9SLM5_VERA1|nr:conserved hypothetical protein [Verticillium alfalfae VaMs.102]EEY19593.1 conserved hypothetical protein [Verticillium alfalfae VaMs.102]
MHTVVQPNEWVAVKLPNESIRIIQVIPNTTISLGKYGSFPSNLIIERPYHLTYEVQDRRDDENFNRLRVVPASELHADVIAEENGEKAVPDESAEADADADADANNDASAVTSANVVAVEDGADFTLVDKASGTVIAREGRDKIEAEARQLLTQQEIETLKKRDTDGGRDIIAKLLLSHTSLDEKTTFSLAKYKILKNKKYLRRFSLIEPESDTTYASFTDDIAEETLSGFKASRRGNYHRKRRRWARTRFIVDQARAGGFSGLVVASTMDPISVVRAALPLLAGGAPISIYSPTIEPLTQLADCFSKARRAGWSSNPPTDDSGRARCRTWRNWPGSDDFPVNPSLLIGPNVQTSRAKRWQVLPGRTHPLMMARGFPGFLFTGSKARGRQRSKHAARPSGARSRHSWEGTFMLRRGPDGGIGKGGARRGRGGKIVTID